MITTGAVVHADHIVGVLPLDGGLDQWIALDGVLALLLQHLGVLLEDVGLRAQTGDAVFLARCRRSVHTVDNVQVADHDLKEPFTNEPALVLGPPLDWVLGELQQLVLTQHDVGVLVANALVLAAPTTLLALVFISRGVDRHEGVDALLVDQQSDAIDHGTERGPLTFLGTLQADRIHHSLERDDGEHVERGDVLAGELGSAVIASVRVVMQGTSRR